MSRYHIGFFGPIRHIIFFNTMDYGLFIFQFNNCLHYMDLICLYVLTCHIEYVVSYCCIYGKYICKIIFFYLEYIIIEKQ